MSVLDDQAKYRAHIQHGEEHPEWMQEALKAVNAWGRGEKTLAHAIAEGLQAAWEMGQVGEMPEYIHPEARRPRMMRSRPAPEPTRPQLLRRSR